MPEYIIDRKGRKHKLLFNELDFRFLMYSNCYDELIEILRNFVSKDTYKKLFELSLIIQKEVGWIDYSEIIGVTAKEYGYNFKEGKQ